MNVFQNYAVCLSILHELLCLSQQKTTDKTLTLNTICKLNR